MKMPMPMSSGGSAPMQREATPNKPSDLSGLEYKPAKRRMMKRPMPKAKPAGRPFPMKPDIDKDGY